ncbi:MAG: hypothetical protein ACPL3S_01665, partial [Halothiobacillaceae bacterium]
MTQGIPLGDAGDVVDKKALRECRQLAQELFSKMEEAREIGDHARIEEIEKEMVALTKAGAMRDLALYREIAPQNITFDGSHKIYRIGQAFSPLFDHAPQRVLSALALGFGDGVNGPATPLQPLLPCDKHFHAWYRREGGRRSCTWVKNRLQEAGVVKKAPGRGKHRKRRARAAWPGMMLHQDASRHEWVAGCFAPHQDRLPKELAAAGITDMAAANRYLREVYLPAFHAEFPQPAQEEGSAFVPWIGGDLDDILCEQYERVVGK